MAEAAIELIGIDKSFGTVRANRDINLVIERGTIRGMVTEQGRLDQSLLGMSFLETLGSIEITRDELRLKD